MISIIKLLESEDFFDYTYLAKDFWRDLIRETQKESKIRFDLENDDPVKNQERTLKFPIRFQDVKFRCKLYQAGGDWEDPIYYFRCQQTDGLIKGISKYNKSAFFVFIPNNKEGNFHLIKTEKGFRLPTNSDSFDRQYSEKNPPSIRKCWESLKKYLRQIVKEGEIK